MIGGSQQCEQCKLLMENILVSAVEGYAEICKKVPGGIFSVAMDER